MQDMTWRSRGARALVQLHERELRDFSACWKRAYSSGLKLPRSDDPNYASLAALLAHVLRAARGYIVWSCETLGLPQPQLDAAPTADDAADRADDYIGLLLEGWSGALLDATDEALEHAAAPAPWGPSYCVDSMLEHAVMHPLRHRFQLEELMQTSA